MDIVLGNSLMGAQNGEELELTRSHWCVIVASKRSGFSENRGLNMWWKEIGRG